MSKEQTLVIERLRRIKKGIKEDTKELFRAMVVNIIEGYRKEDKGFNRVAFAIAVFE